MAPPVTEVALLPLQSGLDVRATLIDAATTLIAQPGCQRVRWAKEHENPDNLRLAIDWDSKAAHEKFMNDAEYGPFLQRLGAIVNGAPTLYHVAFQPFPPNVLSNELPEENGGKGKSAVAEVLHAYFPADYSADKQEKAAADLKGFVEQTLPQAKGTSGESAIGWVVEEVEYKGEKTKALVMAVGWDSVDAHMAYRETDAFKNSIGVIRGLSELKGLNVFHTASHVFEKTG